MNKRRIHELMQADFPKAAPVHQVRPNIADTQGRLLSEQAQVIGRRQPSWPAKVIYMNVPVAQEPFA